MYSYKDTNPVRSVPTLMTSFNLNYFLSGFIPNAATWGGRASIYEFGEDTNIWSITQTFTVIQLKDDKGMN